MRSSFCRNSGLAPALVAMPPIKAKPCMESAAGGMESRPKRGCMLPRDAMRGQAAIPCNSLCELMPCQALRSWINKKEHRSAPFCFWCGRTCPAFCGKPQTLEARLVRLNASICCAKPPIFSAAAQNAVEGSAFWRQGSSLHHPHKQKIRTPHKAMPLFFVVRVRGLEPPRSCPH